MSRPILIAFAVFACIGACTTSSEPRVDPEPPAGDELSAAPVEAMLQPTPAMLEAALTGDPEIMARAVTTQSACNAPSSCPAQFGACTNWSGFSECGFTCGPGTCICKPWINPDCVPGELRGRTTFNSFRVCFDANANACTEWQQTSSFFCGC